MMGKRIRTESLTELVFRDRNKDYGSFQFRKKYIKTLLISSVIGTFLFLLIVLIPFLIHLFRDIQLDLSMEYIYEVEYIPFAPSEDIQLVELAKSHATPPVERQRIPVISDTITPEEEQKPVAEEPDMQEEKTEESDTASYGTRGDKIGRQANTDTAFSTTIDVYPRYPGGEEARLFYLRRHVSYPKSALDNEIQGVVMVVFVIEVDGSVTNVKILQGIGGGCDEEAVRVTREMPKWSPGKRSGRPVRVIVKMPIVFGIPKKT